MGNKKILTTQKLAEKIRKTKKLMREKRGIIIGLQTPQEQRHELLTQTRADLRELVERLAELKEQYKNEIAKNKQSQKYIYVGTDDWEYTD